MSSNVAKDDRDRVTARTPILLDASYVSSLHTYLACIAFSTALVIGCLLHFKKIVKNGVAGFPDEWLPSVSATIGDWYPERNIFQILIALTSGPRIALVSLQYYSTRSDSSSIPVVVLIFGLIRTFSCGGWVYITSSDDHDVHDFLMLTYIVSNIPWMVGGIWCTPKKLEAARKKRCYVATAFFASILPMIWFFVQHKVHKVPGAYSRYSIFEWALIFLDISYDSITAADFKEVDLQILLGRSLHIRAGPSVVQGEVCVTEHTPKIVTSAPVTASVKSPQKWDWSKILKESRPVTSFMSDLYLSYIFWSILTSLIPTLFYFSIWELGIAGHELALLSTLSPCVLGFSPILTWSETRSGRSSLQLLSFSALAAYAFHSPLVRLFMVSFGNICAILRQVMDWTGIDGNGVEYHGVLFGAGLVLSALSKFANHSNNPVWPMVNAKSGGFNEVGLVLAFLALYESHTRPFSTYDTNLPVLKQKSPPVVEPPPTTADWLIPAVTLGSLIFSLHSLLSDPGTLIAWSWTGFKNGRANGPVTSMHGSLTIIAQCVGISIPVLLGSTTFRILEHPIWFVYGAANAFVMYNYRNWFGYAAGLQFSLFLMSIIPFVLRRAAQTGTVGKTYFTAWVVYCILSLGSVWTVAYAFVPGGVYLRERTDLVLATQTALLGLIFGWPRQPASFRLPRSTIPYTLALLASISITAFLVTLYRLPNDFPRPFKPGPRMLTAGIWTLHFGFDNEGRDSQRGVRDIINDMQLDIVGLLETDLHRTVFGNRDLSRLVTEEMGYNVDHGPGPNSHTWGATLLSKFPIINSTHHLLPSPHGELAPAIEAVLEVYGTAVTVIVAHNGQEEDPLDRELQSKELARIMARSYPQPVIFLGYVVTKPLASRPAPYDILITDGQMHDIDSSDWDRWCEYILYRGLYRTAYARLSRGTITDTELQIGQFVLPRYGHGITNETEGARYLRSWKEDLPEYHWLPMKYYGSEESGGVNGHYYHVFNTPLYYKIPDDAVL